MPALTVRAALPDDRLRSATASSVAQQVWSSLGLEVVEQVRRGALNAGARRCR
jgi:hypothetical protein